jgi:hypothetical protein
MNKERDLLPWILGGLSAATIAVAFAAVSTHRDVTALSPPLAPTPVVAAQPAVPPPISAPAMPAASTSPVAAPSAEPDSAPMPAAPDAQTAAQPQVQPGQIWECITKGVKTYSNNPCGEKSTLLDVSPINTMPATPVIHYARAYGSDPRYAPGYADQGAPADDEQYSEDYGAEAGGNSYTVIQGAGFVARRRPEHSHRPPHHDPGYKPGNNSQNGSGNNSGNSRPGNNSGHNSAPVRRN